MAWGRADAFFSARDAWWRSKLASDREAVARTDGPLPQSKSIMYQMQRWNPRVAVQFRQVEGKSHRIDARLGPALQAMSDAIVPAVKEAMDAGVTGLAFEAWRAWPVGTGYSRSMLDIEYDGVGSALVGRLIQRAPYWRHIQMGSGFAVQVLLNKPGRKVKDDIAQRTLQIVRGMQGPLRPAGVR